MPFDITIYGIAPRNRPILTSLPAFSFPTHAPTLISKQHTYFQVVSERPSHEDGAIVASPLAGSAFRRHRCSRNLDQF